MAGVTRQNRQPLRNGDDSVSVTLPDPGPPNLEFEQPADRAHLERPAAAVAERGFLAQVADSGADARRLVFERIPAGAEVHIALSAPG